MRRELGDVGARGEGLGAGAAHDHHADVAVGGEGRDERRQRLPHLEAHRVEPPRVAQDEPRDPARVALDVDSELAHAAVVVHEPPLFANRRW